MALRRAGRWHLIAGSTGAGKTTFARDLSASTGGVRFSIDEWMNTLYWMDCPEKNNFPWAMERIARCEAQIAAVATELAKVGIDAVLDLGFTLRSHRAAWLDRAHATGIVCELHVLDVSAEERWERVSERNGGQSATFSFAVTREMFDFMEARWELPDEAEKCSHSASGPAVG